LKAAGVDVRRPSAEELVAAARKRLPDVVAPGLSILFCGINPGLYSAATGHHFARPGNRFWPTLFAAGFTPRLLRADEDATLLALGLGITNLVARTTASADLLTRKELTAGAKTLERKLRAHRPKVLAMVGLGAYRTAFEEPKASCGLQPRSIGATQIWLLPNPSGLNAHHQAAELAALFGELRRYVVGLS
jgi:double-stranded uracil-DNA glycosylase